MNFSDATSASRNNWADTEQHELSQVSGNSSPNESTFFQDDDQDKIDSDGDETDRMLDYEYSSSEDNFQKEYPPGVFGTISRFFDGPESPIEPTVTPVFKSIQQFPATISKRWPYKLKAGIISCFLLGWGIIFYQLAVHSILQAPYVNGEAIPLLSCSATHAVWKGKNQYCGINGEDCGASDLKEFFFKCPASCKEDSYTWSETAVANYSTIYRPYVIGGNNSYRADSFICASALHHGLAGNNNGFCGRIVFKGPKTNFISEVAGSMIESLPFNSLFPQSYEFDDDFYTNYKISGCRDLRMTLISLNIILSVIFGYIVQDGTLFYWVFAIMGFWTVVLGSNPPIERGTGDLIAAELVSLGFRRFLPYMFGCFLIYKTSAAGQLVGLKASLSRCVLWVGGFWISVLENYTFSALPVNRLTLHDINSQRGGWITVIGIAGFILFAAFGQAYIIWRLGKFKKYISVYIAMIMGLVILGTFKNQTLRIHHYIIGLVLLPGVGFKTTPSLLFFGLLFGLYISGVARWDFDSIIQTDAQLNRGDATNIGGLPELLGPVIEYVNTTDVVATASEKISNIVLQWSDLLSDPEGVSSDGQAVGISTTTTPSNDYRKMWNGYSLIINDVEQYRGNKTNFSLQNWIDDSLWHAGQDHNLFIRLAFANLSPSKDLTGGKMLKLLH